MDALVGWIHADVGAFSVLVIMKQDTPLSGSESGRLDPEFLRKDYLRYLINISQLDRSESMSVLIYTLYTHSSLSRAASI